MNLQQQLNNELDRIWGVINDRCSISCIIKVDLGMSYVIRENEYNIHLSKNSVNRIYDCEHGKVQFADMKIAVKREIIAAIFDEKDEGGNYVLKEVQTRTRAKITPLELFVYYDRTEIVNDFGDKANYPIAQKFTSLNEFLVEDTLANVFFQNCFGRTQEQIDNLKLIKW